MYCKVQRLTHIILESRLYRVVALERVSIWVPVAVVERPEPVLEAPQHRFDKGLTGMVCK